MKKWGLPILALLLIAVAFDAFSQVRVRGYTRKDGTYVAPHYRSAPNSSKNDNYSTRGNYNPYTGKKGSVNPYGQTYSGSVPIYNAPAYSAPLQPAHTYNSHPSAAYITPQSASGSNGWWSNQGDHASTTDIQTRTTHIAELLQLRAMVDAEIEKELEAIRQQAAPSQVEVWKCTDARGQPHYLSYPRAGCEPLLSDSP